MWSLEKHLRCMLLLGVNNNVITVNVNVYTRPKTEMAFSQYLLNILVDFVASLLFTSIRLIKFVFLFLERLKSCVPRQHRPSNPQLNNAV